MTDFETTNRDKEPVKAVFISLDSAVPLYADTMSFLSWKFQDGGMEVIRLGCDGVLQTCTSINSTGKIKLTSVDKEKICDKCRIAQEEIISNESLVLSEKDVIEDVNSIGFLSEVNNRLLTGGCIENVLEMNFDGLPLCRIAYFDFAILTKLTAHSILDSNSVERFMAGVKDLVKLNFSFKRLNNRNDLTHVVYVNGNYSQNTLAREVFERKGITCLSVEPQLTSQKILNRVTLVPKRLSLNPEALHTSDVDEIPINTKMLRNVNDLLVNFGARISGLDFNAYTSLNNSLDISNEIRALSNFKDTHEKIVSYFLSSEDELNPHIITHGISKGTKSNPLGPYQSQIEFTSYLINESEKHPNVGFVIRLHPRMAVNKRDNFESEEHLRYKSLFGSKKIPQNVLVFFGESKISSYYIINESDLVVISWSTIGLESLLLGVPTISTFPDYLMYPLTSISNQPKNQHEMECAIFRSSNFGAPDDSRLLKWMTLAYEGQFFTTTAPRGSGGIKGKWYRLIFTFFKKLGGKRLFYPFMDRVILGDSESNAQLIFAVKDKYATLVNLKKEESFTRQLLEYRIDKKYLLGLYSLRNSSIK